MDENLEKLSELASKAAHSPPPMVGEKPMNPLPSSFDSGSSTADLYGYTTTDSGNHGDAPTPEHRGAIWNQAPQGDLSGHSPPPQATSRPEPARMSSNNYESARAARSEQESASAQKPTTINAAAAANPDLVADNPPLGSPSTATWRPTMFRQQSWSQEDKKRSMQEHMMTTADGVEAGYSSKDFAKGAES